MKTTDLNKLADQLLAKNGFTSTGTPKKEISKRQVFFERKTIITTPMGNRR